jgi:hypothetical protein
MAPLTSRPLEAGQTTIIATLNGALSVRPIRPGPRPKPSPHSSSNAPQNDRRRMVGGPNECAVLRFFLDFRRASGGEEEDNDLGGGVGWRLCQRPYHSSSIFLYTRTQISSNRIPPDYMDEA